ncbi:hypothetical protein [Phaeospirillum tilakii]|uniref:Phasin protein n=1 Tax=Phaeospirillum tilakii TaxID=741673 RepID=A0ABW5CC91_9PROT
MGLFSDLKKKASDALNQALVEHPEYKERAVKVAGDLQAFGQKAAEELQKKAPAVKDALNVGALKAVELGQKAVDALPPAIDQLKGTLANVQAKVAKDMPAKTEPAKDASSK